jgi:hypothetical protein
MLHFITYYSGSFLSSVLSGHFKKYVSIISRTRCFGARVNIVNDFRLVSLVLVLEIVKHATIIYCRDITKLRKF